MIRRLAGLLVLQFSTGWVLQAQPLGELLIEQDLTQRALPLPDTVQIVSFNLHGPPGKRIDEVFDVLQNDERLRQAHVFLLQEVNRNHAGSANRDIGAELAELLKMHYAYGVEMEHGEGGGVRGLAILSRYPLENTRRLLLPVEGPGGRRRIALGTTVRLGSARLRLYNLHLETRISADKRVDQIQGVLEDARDFDSIPMVIAGDFNTITTNSVTRMYEVMQEAGFSTPLAGDEITFQRAFVVRMVLDWIWGRDVTFAEAAVESDIRVSDHRPLWFKIPVESLTSEVSR